MKRVWWVLLVGCQPAPQGPEPPRPKPVVPEVTSPSAAAPAPMATGKPSTKVEVPEDPCPDGMAFVDTVHCPDGPSAKVGLTCTSSERNNPNHLTICKQFEGEQTCRVPKRRQQYCIDRYEFPNRKGGHPPVMVSAYDAAGLCAEQGKRMCFESEWTAACEGPDKLPFPYGHARSAEHCNIDNRYVHPHLSKLHHPDDVTRGPELLRLDQSVPSGSLESCRSGFGVYDLTGNFDEWVMTEWRRGKSKWAGLKGGAWGHVRNACRPITTSHVAHWSYYFISFRCCADPDARLAAEVEPPPGSAGLALWQHPEATAPPHPAKRALDRGWTPALGAVAPHAPKR
jgi:Sulfatase-modifying factor enzyme 1